MTNGFAGMVIAALESKRMAAMIGGATQSLKGDVYIIGPTGQLLIHPDESRVSSISNLARSHPVAEALALRAAGRPSSSSR